MMPGDTAQIRAPAAPSRTASACTKRWTPAWTDPPRHARAPGIQGRGGLDHLDGEDASPLRHGRRDAGGVSDGAKRTELRDPRGQPIQSISVGDVEDERLDGGAARTGQYLGRLAHRCFVPIDQHETIDHVGEPGRAGQPHPSARARCDSNRRHRPPQRRPGSSNRATVHTRSVKHSCTGQSTTVASSRREDTTRWHPRRTTPMTWARATCDWSETARSPGV